MLFEKFFSVGSLLALTLSITLTIKYLKVNFNKEVRNKSHNVNGNNNTINIVELDKKNEENFKTLVNILTVVLVVFLPLYPDFFIGFMRSFSWLPLIICVVGAVVQMYMRGVKRIYDIFYTIPAVIVGVLMYHSVYLATTGDYIYNNIYPRLFYTLSNLNPTQGYASELFSIVSEASAYIGFIVIFLSVIYISFSFIKERGFDKANKYMFLWLVAAFVGDFLASGGLVAIWNGNFGYVSYSYKMLFFILNNFI